MKFEELYEKYKAGTATEFEKEYVEAEIAKANAVQELMRATVVEKPIPQPIAQPIPQPAVELKPVYAPVVEPVTEEEIKVIKKKFRFKTLLKSIAITVFSCLAIAIIIVGVLFGVSVPAAVNGQSINQTQSIDLAKNFLIKNPEYGDFVRLADVDKEFEMETPLNTSYYRYVVEMETNKRQTVKLFVNATTQEVLFHKIDGIDRYDD